MRRLKFYVGLTRDFRSWKVLGTRLNPNDAFEDRYVWFYGPYETREEAERFKKQEKLNPRKKR